MKVIKKIVSFILACSLMFCFIIVANASVVKFMGFDLSEIDEGKHYEVTRYNGDETDLEIIEKYNKIYISSIGAYSFVNNKVVEKVSMSSSVRIIKNDAFSSATALEEITIGQNVNEIQKDAFYNCFNLKKVYFSRTSINIADDAFDGCDDVTFYVYHDSVAMNYAIQNGIDYFIVDQYMIGDANNDFDISITDATKMQRVLADLDADPDGKIAIRSDTTDQKGYFDVTDAVVIQRVLARLTESSLVGEYRYYFN